MVRYRPLHRGEAPSTDRCLGAIREGWAVGSGNPSIQERLANAVEAVRSIGPRGKIENTYAERHRANQPVRLYSRGKLCRH